MSRTFTCDICGTHRWDTENNCPVCIGHCEKTEDEKKYEIIEPYICQKCHKTYGKTNLEYEKCAIYVTCDCGSKEEIYIVNTNNIKTTLIVDNL